MHLEVGAGLKLAGMLAMGRPTQHWANSHSPVRYPTFCQVLVTAFFKLPHGA